ncbi:adult-specific cuticular protein ACP-20 [Lepeophtheirus salmonis]|uniref:Putative LOC100678527 [Nasonia vitripennis] n=1 Tax=Lepeophtheirus salmonis TaxID=72036 RepID=A0A0K2TFP1_LEPSM|nr:cuticle protein 7-like [Lepeophtheirus salmonis]
MLRLIIVSTLFVAFTLGDHGFPSFHQSSPYKQPSPYKPAPYRPHYDESPKPYSYQYRVNDDYAGLNFGAEENSDAKVVSGSYQVALPDGRLQSVTYTADHYNGYVADVKYQGTPVYPKPSYHPSPYKPSPPSYKHVPVYHN